MSEIFNGIYREDKNDSDNWSVEIEGIKENDQSIGFIIDGIEMYSGTTIKDGDRIKIIIE